MSMLPPIAAFAIAFASLAAQAGGLGVSGITVTPHVIADSMRYRKEAEPAVGARVQLFLQNERAEGTSPVLLDADTPITFNGETPHDLLGSGDWAWHDFPSALANTHIALPPGALTVMTFNGRTAAYGPDAHLPITMGPSESRLLDTTVTLNTPDAWLSAVTFLGPESTVQPNTLIVHIANAASSPLEMQSCLLWLPLDRQSPRILFPQAPLKSIEPFQAKGTIPADDRGGFVISTPPLPLTYAAIEVVVARPGQAPFSLWGYLRIKAEHFDISGGWVKPVTSETYLKTLKRLYVNTAHLKETPGYTDTDLYARYPLKYFNDLRPFDVYDTDAVLPRIHAAEFLGEPQYGGGHPVPPQEVWEKLQPYTTSRIATTVTHSEERIWRDYAGLSDFPHYDAYRVSAPSPDAWSKYTRWDGQRIFWGAPLETIGDMCRSLRELNRPMPCAIWSQGPHAGWDEYGRRKRTSPTPDELRMQAYHALSTRITSLYWFNLSAESLVKWRDTLDELGRIGREIRLLDSFLLEGDAYRFERRTTADGKLDWDLASVCGPRAALLFALDLAYTADPDERVFRFEEPRSAQFRFALPAYLEGVTDVFRLDADGLYTVPWSLEDGAVVIEEPMSKVAVYIATTDSTLRTALENRRQELVAEENALNFDPARDDDDFAALAALVSVQQP